MILHYEALWYPKIILQCLRLHCAGFRRHRRDQHIKIPKTSVEKKFTVDFLNYDEKNETIAENPHKYDSLLLPRLIK